jgi:hypothetical protein
VDLDGLPPDAFENNLADFEGELDMALRRIVAARSITENEDDRAYLFACDQKSGLARELSLGARAHSPRHHGHGASIP